MSEQMEQRSEEWFEARKGRITASVVGAILGNAPYMTREQVMRSMVREYHGAEREFKGNIATEWGTANEEGALFEFQLETGLKVDPVGFLTLGKYWGCSPDGLIGDYTGLEIKCPFGIRKDENPKFKSIEEQPHYYDQVQFSMWVTDRPSWYFYQWTPHGTMEETVTLNRSWQRENIPKLEAFYGEYMREREHNFEHHLEPLRAVIDTPDAHKLMAEYMDLKEAADNAEARMKEVKAQIIEACRDKSSRIAGVNVTKVERAGSVSYAKALKAIAPDADLEPYRGKPSTSWRIG